MPAAAAAAITAAAAVAVVAAITTITGTYTLHKLINTVDLLNKNAVDIVTLKNFQSSARYRGIP